MMAAVNTWTIPSDPGFQTRRSEGALAREIDCKRPKPRVKPEAMMIALKNQGSVAQLFNPFSKPPTFRSSRSGSNIWQSVVRPELEQLASLCASYC